MQSMDQMAQAIGHLIEAVGRLAQRLGDDDPEVAFIRQCVERAAGCARMAVRYSVDEARAAGHVPYMR